MGLRQGSGLCSSSSRKYPGTEGMNQNRHWNHHRWHATNSLERTRLSCWCLQNHKWCTYRAPIRYVTKTWSVVLLNKKKTHIYSYLKCTVYDKLLKPQKSFRITLYFGCDWNHIRISSLTSSSLVNYLSMQGFYYWSKLLITRCSWGHIICGDLGEV